MSQHPVLKVCIFGFPERTAKRKVTKQAAGRSRTLELTLHDSQCDGGETMFFEDMCERAHGTRAKRSNRCEKDNVDAGVVQHLGPFRPAIETNSFELELIAGIGKMHISYRADGAVVC